MDRVTGIGGVFFRSEDPEALGDWYRERLGIPVNEHGYGSFQWKTLADPERVGRTVWSLFPSDTDYFGPGSQRFMVNYRVADLDALLAVLRDEGVDVVDGIEEYEYGRFAWIEDPEGNRIELWEPPERGDDRAVAGEDHDPSTDDR